MAKTVGIVLLTRILLRILPKQEPFSHHQMIVRNRCSHDIWNSLLIFFWYLFFRLLRTRCILFNSFYPKWTIAIVNSASVTIQMFTTCWNRRIKGTINFKFQMKAIIYWALRFKDERIWSKKFNVQKQMKRTKNFLPSILTKPLNTIQVKPLLATWKIVTSSRLELCDIGGKVGSDRYLIVMAQKHCLSKVLGPIKILYT